jgi:hypothetical protein
MRTRQFISIGVVLAGLVGTASCGRNATTSETPPAVDAQPVQAAASAAPPSAAKTDFRAAAEPFEVLTETAFSGKPAAVDTAVRAAMSTAQVVRPTLPPAVVGGFDTHVAALDTAHHQKDKADLALASIEVYRDLVSAVPSDAKVPVQVSLLDYAGFRYDADLKATPMRWSDMTQAVAFARENWSAIATRVNDPALAAKVVREIDAMDKAATQKNKPAAARSAKAELDLVDQLEKFFSTH